MIVPSIHWVNICNVFDLKLKPSKRLAFDIQFLAEAAGERDISTETGQVISIRPSKSKSKFVVGLATDSMTSMLWGLSAQKRLKLIF